MTITYLGEDPAGRTANNTKGVRSYTRVFKFKTTDKNDTAWDIGSHASSPRIGDVFYDAWCQSITVTNTSPFAGWTVTAEYSSERELATDPTNDPAVIVVNTEQFQKVAETNISGDSVCNSAGDPFDPPYMMDDSRRVISISKNMSGHPSWILSYADVVNSDSFVVKGVTYAVGVGKVQRVSIGETQTRNGVPFVVVTLEIHCQRDGWILRPLDAGFRQLAWDGLTRINIYNPASSGDTNGGEERVTAPVPLNGAGQALANPTSATAVYGAYTIYTTAVFSALPLT